MPPSGSLDTFVAGHEKKQKVAMKIWTLDMAFDCTMA